MSEPAYDRTVFDEDDRPFRVPPGSAAHARFVFEALGADVEMDFEDHDAEMAAFER